MRPGIIVDVSTAARARLERGRCGPEQPAVRVAGTDRMHLSGDGLGTVEIMRRTGKSKTAVWRWQERFMHEGVDSYCRNRYLRRARLDIEKRLP